MDASSNPIVMWMENTLDFIVKNKKQVLIGVAGIAILVTATVGYVFYKRHVREQAHKDLLQALRYYDGVVGKMSYADAATVSFASEAEKWQKTEQLFKEGYEAYKGTDLGSMFLAYQSESLLHLGKFDEALKVLSSAVVQMNDAAVKDFYRVKLALMLLDSGKEIDKQQGLGLLKKIADDTQSVANEAALYQLGSYYWYEKKFEEAKNYWQMLLVKYGTRDIKQPSQYVDIVKDKMALLSVESL